MGRSVREALRGTWGGAVIGIVQAGLLLGFSYAALEESWAVLPQANWDALTIGAACVAAAALGVIGSNHKGDGKQPFYVFFFGAFLCCAGLVVVACGMFFRPDSEHIPHDLANAPKVVKIVVDDSVAVRFPDEDGNRAGEEVLERNALAVAVEGILKHVEGRYLGAPDAGRRDFFPWLEAEWPRLVNWEPPPSVPPDWQVPCELYMVDGTRCRRVRAGKRPAEAYRAELLQPYDLASPPGLPAQEIMAALGLPSTRDTVVLLIATADLFSDHERDAWGRRFDPGEACVVRVAVPALPRSGHRDSRGASALAKTLGGKGRDKVVRLTHPPGPDHLVGLFPDLAALDEHRPDWDVVRDLDPERREWFGPKTVGAVRAALKPGALDGLNGLIPAAGTRPVTAVGVSEIRLMVLGVLIFFTLLMACVVKHNPLGTGDISELSAFLPRAVYLLGSGLGGLALVVLAIHYFWPGSTWQMAGRPAMTVWAYAAFWSGFVLVPLLVRMYWKPLVAVALLVGLGSPLVAAVLGLPVAGWLFWLPLLGMGLWPVPKDALEGKVEKPPPWAQPARWAIVTTALAVWCSVMLIGLVPVSGAGIAYFNLLVVLGAVLVGYLILARVIELFAGP